MKIGAGVLFVAVVDSQLHLDKNSKDSSPTSLEKSSLKNFTLSFESQEVAICYIHIGDH